MDPLTAPDATPTPRRKRARHHLRPLVLATDGSVVTTAGDEGAPVAAWAYADGRQQLAGGLCPEGTSVVRAELLAIVHALRATGAQPRVHLLVDAASVVSVLRRRTAFAANGWRRANGLPLAHTDLYQQIDALTIGRQVTIQWVKAHASTRANRAADIHARKLARHAVRARTSAAAA